MAEDNKPDDVLLQVKALNKNVLDIKEKSDKIVTVEGDIKTIKDENIQLKADLKTLQDARVQKDEDDKKRDEWIDKQQARKQDVIINPQDIDLETLIGLKLKEHEPELMKMINKDPTRQKEWSIDLDLKAVGDVTIANYTGGTRGLTALRPGIIAGPNRKIHVRDLLPTGTIGPGTEYVFMKENGDGEGAIASVAEGASKPQFDVDLIEAAVKIETIAGWLRVTRKAMNNIQGFTSWLQSRLPEKLLRVEDNLLLNGDGVTPNIKGIQVAGNFTAATGAATINIEQIVEAISQLEELETGDATGIVVRPSDYYAMLLNKGATSGDYSLPNIVTVTSDGVMRILGIPVVKTTAQTVDKFLVGDFRMGAQLLIQEGIRIEFFEQDGTNVRENKVTVRIEETVAFPVYGPKYFVFGDLGDVA